METAPVITYFWAAVLGIVQGVAEFLPISSSGHLALVEHLGMGVEAPAVFDVFLHLATLVVVIAYFRRAILWYMKNDFIVLLYVLAATVPTGIVGVLFKDSLEALRTSPTMICIALLVTASALSVAEIRPTPPYPLRDLGWVGAAVVGLCQALAIVPGISRSGATISGAMICGVDREEAFRFSFIMSVPAVLGAVCLHLLHFARHDGLSELWRVFAPGPYLLGFVCAAAVGYASLRLLDRAVASGRLVWFAGYCFIAGIVGLLYFNIFA